MTFLTGLWFRLGHAVRTRPWVRMAIGGVVIAVGVVELLVGAGQGRIIIFGILLVAGSAAASRSSGRLRGHGESMEPTDRDADRDPPANSEENR